MRVLHVVLFLALAAGIAPAGAAEIHDAARDGRLDQVTALLARDTALVRATDANGRTPLHWAAGQGRTAVAALLLERGAPVEATDTDHRTPLIVAVLRNQRGMARLLLERGADREARDARRRTPLLLVARETGDLDMARLLLDGGADVAARDGYEDTPLELAAWRGFRALVDLFLDRGAQVATRGGEAEALLGHAAQRRLVRLFQLLAERGADLSLTAENRGTLLHAAARGGSVEIVRTLLDKGLPVGASDCLGWTALHFAASRGRADVVDLLLERGADAGRRTPAGATARNLAEAPGHTAVVAAFERRGIGAGPQEFPLLQGPYLGQPPPGRTPQLFAPGIVSTPQGLHSSIAFSPDGSQACWSGYTVVPDSGYVRGTILASRIEDGRWTAPQKAPFTGPPGDEDVPFFSPDGAALYFISRRPVPGLNEGGAELIWMMQRGATGWDEPRPLAEAVNRLPQHWQFSVAADRTLYFATRGRIHRSRFVDGVYQTPEPLGGPFADQERDDAPFIAPDQSYLLFARAVDRGLRLQVSFADGKGGWSAPRDLGPDVNAGRQSLCPMVSPDGRYLFYMATRDGCEGIYWVDASVIHELPGE